MEPLIEPSVSAIVSTLDRPSSLRRCLESLAAGERQPDEVVVVDQGDPAPVRAVIAEMAAGGLHIRHAVQDRRGLSTSQNSGVAAARSDVVAIIDDDCVAHPEWVATVASAFAAPSALVLLTGRILSLPEDGDRTIPVSNRTSEVREELRWPVVPWVVGSGGNFAMRRATYLAVGGNDERLGTGSPGRAGNDMDLFYRALRAGGVARYEPDLVVWHERATAAERRSRRGSYGFGVGACVGRWARDGDRWAWRVLASWVKLRAKELGRRRSWAALDEEARVLGGTVQGLAYGLRLGDRWKPGAGG